MIMRNEHGLITIDFLFSMVLILGFSALMFVLAFTLSMASVTQYITFASARNYAAGHVDQASQEDRAKAKFQELVNSDALKSLYTNGWFKIDKEPNIGDHTKIIPEFQEATAGSNKFWGVGTHFTAAVLSFSVPFFGSTAPDDDGSGGQFQTYLGSYLGREPTTDECLKLVGARWSAIRKLSVSGGSSYGTAGAEGYFPQTDNGC